MARALKCDRCGKFFMKADFENHYGDDQNAYYLVNTLYGRASENIYDLCIDCYSELKDWMGAKKNEHI